MRFDAFRVSRRNGGGYIPQPPQELGSVDMSGMSSSPTSSAPPSSGRADDLFALAKFVMSADSHVHLENLRDAEIAAKMQTERASKALEEAASAMLELKAGQAEHAATVAEFEERRRLSQDLLANRLTALEAREAEVSRREEKCGERERDHKREEANFFKTSSEREVNLTAREADIKSRVADLNNKAAELDRRKEAIAQAMRS